MPGPLRWRRIVTWAVVAAVGVAGATGIEAWPLTGWRLFAQRRGPVVTRLEARVVDRRGVEAPVPFAELPHGYSGAVPVLAEMARSPAEEREPACAAWAEATAQHTGTAVAEVRVYRIDEDVRDGSRRAGLAWTCGRTGR